MSPHTDAGALLNCATCRYFDPPKESDTHGWCQYARFGANVRDPSNLPMMPEGSCPHHRSRRAASHGSAGGEAVAWLYEMAHYIKPSDADPFRQWKLVVTIDPPPAIPEGGVRNVVPLYALSPPVKTGGGEQSEVQSDYVMVPKSALAWLNGEAPDADGKWFGDGEDESFGNMRRKYWWRSKFRALCGSVPVAQACTSPQRTALQKCSGALGTMPGNLKIAFTGEWAHLGTTTISEILDEADAALSVPSAEGKCTCGYLHGHADDCPALPSTSQNTEAQ